MREPRATVDFETRSTVPLAGSRGWGSWRYSIDPTTEVLCLAFRLPYWKKGRVELWHPAFPHLGIEEEGRSLGELFLWVHDGGLVEAHNAFFERCIWLNKCVGKMKQPWPEIHADQWRCSAAKAAAHTLPRGLDEALEAMKIPVRKDEEGAKLMRQMVQPRR